MSETTSVFCLFVNDHKAAVVLKSVTHIESIFASLIPRFAFSGLDMDDDTISESTQQLGILIERTIEVVSR